MSRGQSTSAGFDGTTRAAMPEQGAVAVHLLRHGEVAGWGRREVRGHTDTPLSPDGLAQHEALAAWFAAHEPRPDLILCSDLSRCRDLGERLAAATGAPLRLLPALREQHMGAWEGRTWQEINTELGTRVNDYWASYVQAAPPGGESLLALAARVRAARDEHVLPRGQQQVAVVTHIGPIRVLLCDALGLPLDVALRFAPPAASHTSLLYAAAGAVVQGLGERPWLAATSGTARAPAASARGDAPASPHVRDGAPRLALSGSAGTGKTTLGRRLAESLGVPFLEEGMRERLAGGLQLHRLSHDELRRLVEDLWQRQAQAEAGCSGGFVADRSAADFAAFWMHYGFHHDERATEPWMAATLQHVPRYDAVVLLPWGVLPLARDGVRSTNRWLQFSFQSLVEGLLQRHAPPDRLLRLPATALDLEARVEWVLGRVGRPQPPRAR